MEYEFDKWDGYGKRPADGSPRVILDLMEYEHGVFRIDGSLEGFEEMLPDGLEILVNGEPWDCEHRAGVVQRDKADPGCRVLKRAAFAVEIPEKCLGKACSIQFRMKQGYGKEVVPGCGCTENEGSKKRTSEQKLTIVTSDYQAKVTSALRYSWWSFGAYVVSLEWTDRLAAGICIEKQGRVGRMMRETALLREILMASYGSKQMFVMRSLYWLAMPVYARKNIWLTFDKLYKGGDCGEYFYRYMADMAAQACTDKDNTGRKRADMCSTGGKCADKCGTGRNQVDKCDADRKCADRCSADRGDTADRNKQRNRSENRYRKLIEPVYVIRKDAKDYARLVQEGYQPCVYRSRKQRLSYLYASMVFATHSGVPSFCGFNKWEVRFVQDRIRAVNTCIQHGLSVQDLTYDSHRLVNNNKRYYCASRYEIENLSKPSYDYKEGVLRLTGIPRCDGLVNRDKKQILIAPTWRSYVAMPSVMGEKRPYNPEFVHTDYFRIYQELLNDRKLRETAEKYGYRILYLLHPTLNEQIRDFQAGLWKEQDNQPVQDHEKYGSEMDLEKGLHTGEEEAAGRKLCVSGRECVQVVSSLDLSYEQALTESSLMVTDYSGVQFDFAYMRKPVVYFHAPELPPHYEEGGFFYDTQGFGEICTNVEDLVRVICGYMENDCQLSGFYRERQEDFFAYADHANCRRIYEDALQYQAENAVTEC